MPLFHFYGLIDGVQLITVIIWCTAEQCDDSKLHDLNRASFLFSGDKSKPNSIQFFLGFVCILADNRKQIYIHLNVWIGYMED